jgi:hypothetical protein
MKPLPLFILFILSLTLLSSSCKKHIIKPVDQLSLLPPATQKGANTFGCLVNGQAFVPGGPLFSGSHMQCNYIYTAGGYNFTVAADNDGNTLLKSIIIGTDSLAIAQEQTLIFKTSASGNADALYDLIDNFGNQNQYVTNSVVSGELTITKLDEAKQIVAGTFYFNAVNSTNDTVKITDGRFDMLYTR